MGMRGSDDVDVGRNEELVYFLWGGRFWGLCRGKDGIIVFFLVWFYGII